MTHTEIAAAIAAAIAIAAWLILKVLNLSGHREDTCEVKDCPFRRRPW